MKKKLKPVDISKPMGEKPKPTRYPGVDDALIIPSYPIYIKENSYKPSKKKDK